jgi:hypothetical protein
LDGCGGLLLGALSLQGQLEQLLQQDGYEHIPIRALHLYFCFVDVAPQFQQWGFVVHNCETAAAASDN